MDLKEIKAIYRFLKGTDIAEIEIERGGEKISIKRALARAPIAEASLPDYSADYEATRAGSASEATEVKSEPVPEPVNNKLKTVTAPMVGTFYMAPSPEAPDFVEIGSVVKAGQSLCIIEAMKLMNEVESEFGGKVVSILVENGNPVEYGEPLFTIEV